MDNTATKTTTLSTNKETFMKSLFFLEDKIVDPVLNLFKPMIQAFQMNKRMVFGILTLLVYVILSYIVAFKYNYFGYETYSYYANVVVISIGIGLMFSQIYKYYIPNTDDTTTVITAVKRMGIFLLALFALFGIIYAIGYSSTVNDYISIILTFGVTLVGLYYIWKALEMTGFGPKIKNNRVIQFIYKTLRAIPYMLVVAYDYLEDAKPQMRASPTYIKTLFLIEVAVIATYFLYPYLVRKLYTRNSKLLLDKPIYLNQANVIGGYEDLKPSKNEKFDFRYNYGLSCWVYLDNIGANYNDKASGFMNIINYGDKPTIAYNPKTNTLRVTSQEGIDGQVVIYENTEVPLQKWHYFVINYDGGNTDVFMNGTLVGTKQGVIPFMKYDNIVTGSENGLQGGICTVQYYNAPISKSVMDLEYASFKDKTPPTI